MSTIEYEPGECDNCGHDRTKTRDTDDGERVCILCETGISGGRDDAR